MNAIEQVLSIPEIKSEHPRLYIQALGELETIKGQAARIAELEARVKELEAGLLRIAEMGEHGSMNYTMAEVSRALLETK